MAFLIPISHMIPVLPPQSAAVVDARDVAEAMWLAAQKGCEVNATSPRDGPCRWGCSSETGTGLQKRVAAMERGFCRFSRRWQPRRNLGWHYQRSALISLATVRLMRHERERTRFNHERAGEN